MKKLPTSRVLAVLVTVAVAGCSAPGGDPSPGPAPSVTSSVDSASLDELFALTSDPVAAAEAAGLPVRDGTPALPSARTHVDVVVDGQAVVVPAGIGVSPDGTSHSPLNTRAADGVVYSSEPATLGQLLTAWGVPFDGPCIGEVCVDNVERVLLVYKDGKAVGDPANLPLTDLSEVFVWVGAADVVPPVRSSYQFPS